MPQNVPIAAGLPNISVTGFFSVGDAQQPFVSRLNEVSQFTDDMTWVTGRHSTKFGLDIRQEHMVIDFVNRPNGDFTFTGSTTARTGNALADFLLGLPAQFRRATQNTAQDGTGWLYSAYVQDEFRPIPRVTINAGLRYELPIPFEDVNGALNSFRPGQQSTRFPECAARSRLSRTMPACPPAPTTPTRTTSRRASASCGIRPARADRACAGAWGIFYDALAGQGDFFQNGVLAPPFTPLLEINSPPAALTLSNPARRRSAAAPPTSRLG